MTARKLRRARETEAPSAAVELVRPTLDRLASYQTALERGWSGDNLRGEVAAREELARIAEDAEAFVAQQTDREARGRDITLPDGSKASRIPGFHLWIWDGDFCGSIGLRWRHGSDELPPYVLGHIGYSVVPWKRGRGYAKAALGMMLVHARAEGLGYVELTTDPDNLASQRVIVANGGTLVGPFTKPPQYGSVPGLRFRISLARLNAMR
jgi:predicted acetyltransferase